MLHQNGAGNGAGVMDSYGLDPNDMPRPASVQFSGPSVTWNLGTYAYDGAGNVKTVGNDKFVYDELSRLKSATPVSVNYFFLSAPLGIAGQHSEPQRPCQIGFEIVRVF